jgi:hypothetical protein
MKKYIFITIFALINSSITYASFPVDNINKIENNLTIESQVKKPETPLANWSLILGLSWFPAMMLSVIFAFAGQEGQSAAFIILAILSFLGAIVMGIRSLLKREGSRWKAIIGLALTLGVILIGLFSAIADSIDIGDFTY